MANTEQFEMIARQYDTEERMFIAKISSDAMKEYKNEYQDKRMIDFGCGTGLIGLELYEECKEILFIDSSKTMIEVLNDKIDRLQLQNASTLCFDLEEGLPNDLHSDVLVLAQVLLHIPNTKEILERFYEILHKEGTLLLVDFVKNENIQSKIVHNGFKKEELLELCKEIGFKDLEYKEIYIGEKIFMNQDATMFILRGKK